MLVSEMDGVCRKEGCSVSSEPDRKRALEDRFFMRLDSMLGLNLRMLRESVLSEGSLEWFES